MYKFFGVSFLALLSISVYDSYAQNYPVYNSYYNNPFLYNPAEAATDYSYIFLDHRRQWVGVEGAPTLTTLSFSTMFNNTHAGMGAKASSYKRGILSTTDLSVSYAFGVPFDKRNTLFLGLSGGAISNNINMSKVADPSDPALSQYLDNNFQPAANFGMLFRSASGLNFGVTLPQLFAPIYNESSNFSNTAFTPLDNMVISAYYKKTVASKIVNKKKKGMRARVKTGETLAPLEFYMLYKYAKVGNNQLEALVKLNLSQNFWLGASYKQPGSFGGITGISTKYVIISYSYEPGGQTEPGFSSGTHEIQLGVRLGKQKRFKRVMPLLRSTITTTNEQHIARFQQTVEDADRVETKDEETKKYYVVIKAFGDFTGADQFKKKLIEEKFNADIFYYSKDRKYYVHVLETGKSADASDEVRNLKTYTKLKDAKVLTVVTPKPK